MLQGNVKKGLILDKKCRKWLEMYVWKCKEIYGNVRKCMEM